MGTKTILSFATAWVNIFTRTKRGEDIKHCDDVANGFGETMDAEGHIWVIKQEQDDVWPADWIDRKPLRPAPSTTKLCNQTGDDSKKRRGIDTVDIALISTHGGFLGTEPDYGPICTIGFNQPPGRVCSCRMRLGNGRLKWLILDCCHSLQTSTDPTGVNPDRLWRHSFDGLHILFGFAGECTDGPWFCGRGKCFAAMALMGHELAESWMIAASFRFAEDNPGVAAAGRDKKDAVDRLDNETFASSYSSIPNKEVKYIAYRFRSAVGDNANVPDKG